MNDPVFSQASESFKQANPHLFPVGGEQDMNLVQKLAAADAEPTKAEIRSEKQLQEQITGFLTRNNTIVIRSRTDTKTSNNVGTPDLIFAVQGRAVAFEVKMPGKKPAKEQREMMLQMTGNGWACFIIHSYDEAVEIFQKLLA